MGVVFLSLALGAVIGFLWRNSPGRVKKANLISLAGLFFLLLVMGAQLGANQELLSGLKIMGRQAFIIAGFCIAGSVVMVQLASSYIQKKSQAAKAGSSGKAGEEH